MVKDMRNDSNKHNELNRIEDKIDSIISVQTDIRICVEKIKSDVAINTTDLTEHKEGVIQNRKRIEELEKSSVVLAGIKSIIMLIATVIGIILALKQINFIK